MDLCAFEDRRLVLACLLQPWLRCQASRTLVTSLIPDPTAFFHASCVAALGLPAGTPLPFTPPGSRDPQPTRTLGCGHNPHAGHGGGGVAAATAGDDSPLQQVVQHLPFRLMNLGDTSAYAAARGAGVPVDRSADERDSKRARVHGSGESSASADVRRQSSSGPTAGTHAPRGGAAAVAAVAMADPGMHSRHIWWRTAAAALAALFTDPEGPLGASATCSTALAAGSVDSAAGHGALGMEAHGGGPRRADSGTSGAPRRQSSNAAGVAGWAGLGPCCHDVALLLQRVLQVAMVRTGRTMHACLHDVP